MTRFFFDYTNKDRSLFDYRGEEFKGLHGALEFAEAIAHDLKWSLFDDWNGWSVQVRNQKGELLFSLPIVTQDLMAA